MFEDIQITHLDSPAGAMFALAVVNLALMVWLKHGFPREWRLAGWALLDVRRIWQRSADEAPRTGGVIIAHIQGGIALATISYACLDNAIQGFALGAVIVVVRLIAVQVFGRFTLLELLVKESADIDRHLRTWMAGSVSVIAIVLSLRSQLNEDVGCNLLLSAWMVWSLFRFWRVFQTSINRLSRYSFAIVYLCSLEIIPTAFIIRLVISSLS
tara:strand:+ start:537 stop:1175 length:639 start_codon:yes stop_codon:yes gene_type:complete